MALNVNKTKFMIFHNKGKKIDLQNTSLVYNNNPLKAIQNSNLITPIERIHSMHPVKNLRSLKLLGIYLDENLNFNINTDKLCAKLSRSIFIINRAKHLLNDKSLRTLYFALFHSHLLYCPLIYSSTSQKNVTKIFKLQKKVSE